MEKLSFSLEDYIEEIYNQVLKNGQAKVTAIADALGVRKASVTGALNVLSEKNLLIMHRIHLLRLLLKVKK